MASFDARHTMVFGDGEYAFRLAIAQLLELQELTKSGPLELYDRLRGRDWRVQDIREPIRLGLIGAGMAPTDAVRLVQRYVEQRPLLESVPVAAIVVMRALAMPEDLHAGKTEAVTETGASPPPPSTGPVPSSGSDPTSSEA